MGLLYLWFASPNVAFAPETVDGGSILYNADVTKGTPQLQDRILHVNLIKSGVETLLLVLSEEERFVIEKHLIAGLDWDCVLTEFEKRWGNENLKSKRSLINYQNKALRKMVAYVQENYYVFDFQWLWFI